MIEPRAQEGGAELPEVPQPIIDGAQQATQVVTRGQIEMRSTTFTPKPAVAVPAA
jgi:hypothetical protein